MTTQHNMPTLPEAERDESLNRLYLPLPGGWEVQTKGKGSTFRIAHTPTKRRFLVIDDDLHEPLELLALDCRKAIHERDAATADLRAHSVALAEKVRELEAQMPRMVDESVKWAAAAGAYAAKVEQLEAALAASRQPVGAEAHHVLLLMADGKTTLAEYLANAVEDEKIGDDWTKGYEECRRWLNKVIGPQLAAQQPATVDRDAVLEEAARICDAIESDKWALYKGREPYKGNEPGRADPHVQGESDGAGQCASRIRSALSQQERKEGWGGK